MLKCLFSTIVFYCILNFVECVCVFVLVDYSGHSGVESVAKFSIIFKNLCMVPMNGLSCVNVLGFSNGTIASVFLLVGVINLDFFL